jgi:ketosteroid isomerase-like protein
LINHDPIAIARSYLAAMEARDLAAAQALLAENFAMVFPGGVRFTQLSELVAWARPRYRHVQKRFTRFDAAAAADGTVVTCFGTLEGAWPDGTTFGGIRFCDWFLVGADGLIHRQEVWNDLAETGRQS